MRTFRNEQIKFTVEIEDGVVAAYKDCAKSILFPDGRKEIMRKPLKELRGALNEDEYIEHLKTIGYEEVRL